MCDAAHELLLQLACAALRVHPAGWMIVRTQYMFTLVDSFLFPSLILSPTPFVCAPAVITTSLTRGVFVMARRILSSALWSSASLLSRPSRRGISMGDAARNPRAAATPTPLRARLQAHYGRNCHFPRVQADHMFALVEVLSLPI